MMNPTTRQSIIKRYEAECGENTVVNPEQRKPIASIQGEIQGQEEGSAEVAHQNVNLCEPVQCQTASGPNSTKVILENGLVIPPNNSGRNATDNRTSLFREDSGQGIS